MKFRKRPVVIEAIQFIEAMLRGDEPLPPGVRIGMLEMGAPPHKWVVSYHCYIDTLEGPLQTKIGDWIITGVNGEHYPCKPDIFEKTYEPA